MLPIDLICSLSSIQQDLNGLHYSALFNFKFILVYVIAQFSNYKLIIFLCPFPVVS